MTITLYSTGKAKDTSMNIPFLLIKKYIYIINNSALGPLFLFHELQVDLLSKYVRVNN